MNLTREFNHWMHFYELLMEKERNEIEQYSKHLQTLGEYNKQLNEFILNILKQNYLQSPPISNSMDQTVELNMRINQLEKQISEQANVIQQLNHHNETLKIQLNSSNNIKPEDDGSFSTIPKKRRGPKPKLKTITVSEVQATNPPPENNNNNDDVSLNDQMDQEPPLKEEDNNEE